MTGLQLQRLNLEASANRGTGRRAWPVRGFSLLEVIVAMGIGAVVMMGLAQIMVTFAQQMKSMRATGARSEVVRNVRQSAGQILSLQASQALTPSLEGCLRFDPDSDVFCQSRSGGEFVQTPLQLVSHLRPDRPLAGPESMTAGMTPVYYSLEGRLCEPGEPGIECPIQAIVSYTPFCASGEDQCSGARSIRINYQIRIRPDVDVALLDLGPFRPEEGHVTLEVDQGFALRLYEAMSFTGGFLNEIEMAQGLTLSAKQDDFVRVRVMIKDQVTPDRIELRGYRLPEGCEFEDLGGACPRPPYSNYQLLATINASEGATISHYSERFVVGEEGRMEVVAISYAEGYAPRRSETSLRVTFPGEPRVRVDGPGSLMNSCTSSDPFQFEFQAVDDVQIMSSRAWVVPNLKDGSQQLPGFSFDLTSPAPQFHEMTYDQFIPNRNYTMYFEVENILAQRTADSHNFFVRPDQEIDMVITHPQSGDFIRAVDSLVARAVVDLKCGDSIDSFTFEVLQEGTTVTMPEASAPCAPDPTADEDRNTWICERTFTCNEWLGLPDCESYSSLAQVDFVLRARATSPDMPSPPLVRSQNFRVSGKITARLDVNQWASTNSVQFYYVSAGDPLTDLNTGGPTQTLRILFAGRLPEPTTLRYTFSTSETAEFVVPEGVNTYNLTVNVPSVSATLTLSTTPQSDHYIHFEDPHIAYFDRLEEFTSCATQANPVVCEAPQVRRMEVLRSNRAHDNVFHSATDSSPIQQEITYRESGNIDIISIHRRTKNRSIARIGLRIAHNSGATTVTSPVSLAADVLPTVGRIDDNYWAQHRHEPYMIPGDRIFVRADVSNNVLFDAFFVRQCYCADP